MYLQARKESRTLKPKIKWLVGLIVVISALFVVPAAFADNHGGSSCFFGSCNTTVPVAAQIAAQVATNPASTSQSNESSDNSASSEGGKGGSGGDGGNGGTIDQSSNASAPTCNVIAYCSSSADGGASTSNDNTSGNANSSADGGDSAAIAVSKGGSS